MLKIPDDMLPFFFPFFWCSVCYLLAKFGGWSAMASKWLASTTLVVNKRYFRSARIGSVNYNGALVTGATREGLYLGVLAIFRVGHPPLLLPWDELTLEPRQSRFLTSLKFSDGRSIRLTKSEFEGLVKVATAAGAQVDHLRPPEKVA